MYCPKSLGLKQALSEKYADLGNSKLLTSVASEDGGIVSV